MKQLFEISWPDDHPYEIDARTIEAAMKSMLGWKLDITVEALNTFGTGKPPGRTVEGKGKAEMVEAKCEVTTRGVACCKKATHAVCGRFLKKPCLACRDCAEKWERHHAQYYDRDDGVFIVPRQGAVKEEETP